MLLGRDNLVTRRLEVVHLAALSSLGIRLNVVGRERGSIVEVVEGVDHLDAR